MKIHYKNEDNIVVVLNHTEFVLVGKALDNYKDNLTQKDLTLINSTLFDKAEFKNIKQLKKLLTKNIKKMVKTLKGVYPY